jgi:Amt family ammonium transporter
MGVRDFAGGLVVHAAAGAAGLALVLQIWREERKRGFKESPQVRVRVSSGWLALSVLLLWIGWFGFNAGSVLAFTSSALAVVITTFLAASSSLLATMAVRWLLDRRLAGLDWAANGVLMGLIVITPLAGFVSPASAVILGILGALIYIVAEHFLSRVKWFSDPIGLFPGHFIGGIFGVLMVAFFTQAGFAAASGSANLPNGLLFGGGMAAFSQLAVQAFAILVVVAAVFALSFASLWAIGRLTDGITDSRFYKGLKGRKT